MRYINVVISLLMLTFIAVQYNDPDGPLWMLIYLIPAVFAGIGGIRPNLLTRSVTNKLLVVSIAAAAAGTLYFWPKVAGWWQKDVWIQELSGETAREGMGMMIVTIVLAITWFGANRTNTTGNQ